MKYQEAERQVQSISNEFSSHLVRTGVYQLTSHPKNIYKFRIFSSTKCISPNIGHPLGQRREKYVLWCYQQVGPKWFASWSSSQSRDGRGVVSETLPRGLLRSNYSHNAGKMLSVFFPSHSLMSLAGRGGESPRNYSDTWPLGSPNAGAVRIQLSSIKPEISDLQKKSHKATPLFSVKKYSFHEKKCFLCLQVMSLF